MSTRTPTPEDLPPAEQPSFRVPLPPGPTNVDDSVSSIEIMDSRHTSSSEDCAITPPFPGSLLEESIGPLADSLQHTSSTFAPDDSSSSGWVPPARLSRQWSDVFGSGCGSMDGERSSDDIASQTSETQGADVSRRSDTDDLAELAAAMARQDVNTVTRSTSEADDGRSASLDPRWQYQQFHPATGQSLFDALNLVRTPIVQQPGAAAQERNEITLLRRRLAMISSCERELHGYEQLWNLKRIELRQLVQECAPHSAARHRTYSSSNNAKRPSTSLNTGLSPSKTRRTSAGRNGVRRFERCIGHRFGDTTVRCGFIRSNDKVDGVGTTSFVNHYRRTHGSKNAAGEWEITYYTSKAACYVDWYVSEEEARQQYAKWKMEYAHIKPIIRRIRQQTESSSDDDN